MSIIHGRSTKAIRLFRDQPAALAVYWLYCARRNHEGVAYPSLRGLVKDTGWSINPCREARDWLVNCGALERIDQTQERYIRPEWRILPETDRKHLIAFDKSEYYRVTGILVIEGKTYDMLYAPAKDADDVSHDDTSYSHVDNDEQNADVSLRETSSVSPDETSHAAQHAQNDTELSTSTSEPDSSSTELDTTGSEIAPTGASTSQSSEPDEPDPPSKPKRKTPHESEFDALAVANGHDPAELKLNKTAASNYWSVASDLHKSKFPVERIPALFIYCKEKARHEKWSALTVNALGKYAPDFIRDNGVYTPPTAANGVSPSPAPTPRAPSPGAPNLRTGERERKAAAS